VVKGADEKPKSYTKKMASSHKTTRLATIAVRERPIIVMGNSDVRWCITGDDDGVRASTKRDRW
jgi:hypothetical protein